MGIADGQPVDAAVVNPAFLDANDDDAALGILDLQNVEAISGPAVFNIQREHNSIASFVGKATGTVFNSLPSWTNNDVGTSLDDLKERIEALTATFNAITGHTHDGSAGEGGPISLAGLSPPLMGYFLQGIDLSAVTGGSTDVTPNLTGSPVSNGSAQLGVVVNAPYNKVIIRQASGPDANDEFLDGFGNEVYGRVTESSGTWTLTYYVDIAGTETPYAFGGSEDVRWYYQQLFNPLVTTPVYDPAAFVPSENATQDVVDASATQRGVVSTGTQSFAGAKTFTGNVVIQGSTTLATSLTGVLKAASGVVSASAVSLATEVTGTLPIGNGGTGQTSALAAFNALSPLTTKGDLLTRDVSNNVRLPVGTDGFVLSANSATATGLEWVAAGGGGSGFDTPTTDSSFGNSVFNPSMTGTGNTAVGPRSLDSLTSGNNNTAYGPDAGTAITTGSSNVALGYQSLKSFVAPSEAVAVGMQALENATAGTGLTAIGYQALRANTGNSNTAVGNGALRLNAAGNNNTAVGASTLRSVVTGVDNTAVGRAALELATGSNNTALGNGAGASVVGGVENTLIGTRAGLTTLVAGNDNVVVGHQAACGNGSVNTVIGAIAGNTLTTGAGNILIGPLSEPSAGNATQEAVLGSNFSPIANFFLGQNPRSSGAAISSTTTLQPGGNPTGTNLSAAVRIFRVAGARGTGTGDGGPVRFATAPAGASGSALNALVDRWEIDANSGYLLPLTDVLYDIGTDVKRVQNIFVQDLQALGVNLYDQSAPTSQVISMSADSAAATPRMTIAPAGGIEDLAIDMPGGLLLQEGTNRKYGVATLAAGTVTVSTNKVKSTSRVFTSRQAASGTLGHLSISNIVDGVSFDIDSSSATETSDIVWMIIDAT